MGIQNLRINEEKIKNLAKRRALLQCSRESLTGYATIDKPWLKYYSEEEISSQLEPKTAYEYLYEKNKDHLDEKKINYYGNKISYKFLFDEIEKYRIAFINLGIKAGDVVSFTTITTPELIFSMYALNRIGAISNMIDPRTQGKGLRQYLNETKSKYLFSLGLFNEETKEGIKDTQIEKVFVINPTNYAPKVINLVATLAGKLQKANRGIYTDKIRPFNEFYDLAKKPLKEDVKDKEYEPDYPVAITHTGGTTGFPKGVLHTNDNFNHISHQFENSGIKLTRDDVFLNVTVPFVAFGIINAMHHFLSVGSNSIIIADYKPPMTAKLVSKYNPTIMLGAPSYFEGILDVKKASRIKYLIAGAEATKISFENEMNKKIERLGGKKRFIKGYGLTEVSACATVASYNECNKVGSVGIPLVDTTVGIFNPDTYEEMKYGELGEVCISGPGMMTEYYNNPEETSKIIRTHRDGKQWVHSGDIGYIDEDGVLFITDRIKRIFTINGFKIYPSRLENLITLLPEVSKCSVIGVEDGPNYKMVMHIVPAIPISNNELDSLVHKTIAESDLPNYYEPSEIIYKEDLPINHAGKVDVIKLKEEYIKAQADKKTLTKKRIKK